MLLTKLSMLYRVVQTIPQFVKYARKKRLPPLDMILKIKDVTDKQRSNNLTTMAKIPLGEKLAETFRVRSLMPWTANMPLRLQQHERIRDSMLLKSSNVTRNLAHPQPTPTTDKKKSFEILICCRGEMRLARSACFVPLKRYSFS